MIDEATLEKVKKFPPQYQDEVKDFIEFLEEKKIQRPEKKDRQFGALKGFVNYIAPDFDAPLEDFKDYM
jgi:mRNA-degrading endonuclease RelE of RelBE toxin-antitoxin system